MKVLSLILVACCALVPANAETSVAAAPLDGAVVPAGWVVKKADCICGISDPSKISNPAQVDYDTLLGSTPQMKEIKRKKIDPQSREGRALKSKAKTLVARSCQTVKKSKGHCGVWKKISNRDSRAVVDITTDVTAEF